MLNLEQIQAESKHRHTLKPPVKKRKYKKRKLKPVFDNPVIVMKREIDWDKIRKWQ